MNEPETVIRTEFERILASLSELPDVTHTQPSTIRSVDFIGTSRPFIIVTYRMRERGDTVFLEMIGGDGQALRLVIPPAVVDTIVRQRDVLTTKVRRKIGKANAEERKRRGEPLHSSRKRELSDDTTYRRSRHSSERRANRSCFSK
jgi:hypothetical protein